MDGAGKVAALYEGLTERQRVILRLLARDHTIRECLALLGLGNTTSVYGDLAAAREMLGVVTNAGAVVT